MKTNKITLNIAGMSLVTALLVGGINTASAYIVYRAFLPKVPTAQHEPLITASVAPKSAKVVAGPVTNVAAVSSNTATATTPAAQPLRQPSSRLVAGQPAQPTQVITDPSGQISYRWCSGINPQLDDAVCEAIVSIVANPTSSNPHLSAKAKQFLSLLPADVSLNMDESSWTQTSPTSGTMLVVAHTHAYGNIRLRVTMQKIKNVWMVSNGQLA